MLPVFTYPWAFVGLAALPALTAIYLLRNRHRRVVVSSLLLWLDQRESREGGTRIDRLQTPLLFFLELLALLLLVLAAAGPYVHSAENARPLVVVLDDSYSMRAGGNDSPRRRAVAAVEAELKATARPWVRFVLAGDRPQLLGDAVDSAAAARRLLDGWRCPATSASLDEALSLAAEVGGEPALLLVVTDKPPTRELDKGRVQWWAFGEPRSNLAFVGAARTRAAGADRCLLEVANLSGGERSTELVVEAGDPPQVLRRSTVRLEGGQTQRVVLQLGPDTPALRARLDDDDLAVDNTVHLLSDAPRPVRVEVAVADAPTRRLVEKALQSTRAVKLTDTEPELRVGAAAEEGPAWSLELIAEKEVEAYVGPFVLDRTHPLTEGLSLRGVVWAAGKETRVPGGPVVMAGNVPLLTDDETAAGGHALRLRLRHDLSTLTDSPDWPILLANLVGWRAASRPGLKRPNLRLGEEAVLSLAAEVDRVELATPDGEKRTVPVRDRRVVARAEWPGVSEFRVGEERVPFAANALNRDESDLTGCASGRWGDWLDETSLRMEYRSVSWVFLLAALAVLAAHLGLVARAGRQRRSQR